MYYNVSQHLLLPSLLLHLLSVMLVAVLHMPGPIFFPLLLLTSHFETVSLRKELAPSLIPGPAAMVAECKQESCGPFMWFYSQARNGVLLEIRQGFGIRNDLLRQ